MSTLAANEASHAHAGPRLAVTRVVQSVILAAIGLFVFEIIWTGHLSWYINLRYLLVTLAGALGLTVLAVVNLLDRHAAAHTHDDGNEMDTDGVERVLVHPDDARRDDVRPGDADHDGGNHRPHRGAAVRWLWLLVALPALLGLLAPARPLGSSAVANKGISSTAPLTAGGNTQPAKAQIAPADRTILDWVRAFNFESDPSVFSGQPADVIGFVYHDARLSTGQFLVVRFGITCCVADAAAIGMIVNWPQAGALADNSWVRARGPVAVAALNGQPIPQVQASSVEPVAEPANPYLYP